MVLDEKRFRLFQAQLWDVLKIIKFINERGVDLLRSGSLEVKNALWQARWMSRSWTRVVLIEERETRELVAIASLHLRYTWRKGIGTVEYVLTDSDVRGEGLGRAVMEALIEQARSARPLISKLELVSEPERTAARALYEKLGFTLVEGSDRHYELSL